MCSIRRLKMNTVSQRVPQMRPSSFSEEERNSYTAEKMMLRQFILMKQQDRVPSYLTVEDMKTWLLAGRCFPEEFVEITEMTKARTFLMSQAWTAARHFCLSQMEQELLKELDEEEQLSRLFSRKVTLEGIHMLVSVVRSGAEEDVETLLKSLFSELLKTFAGVHITGGPLAAVDTKPAELELERSAALLIPQIVETALKFHLEEPEGETEAAAAEIGRLLAESAGPCLTGFGPFPNTLLLWWCTLMARCMVGAVCQRLDERSKTFQLIDYDNSSVIARESIDFAIKEMETAASSQGLHQLWTPEITSTHFEGIYTDTDTDIDDDDDTDDDTDDDFVEKESFFSCIWKMMTCCCSQWY